MKFQPLELRVASPNPNWPAILNALLRVPAFYGRAKKLSSALGVTESAVSYYRSGKRTPTYAIGYRILTLWEHHKQSYYE